jgi:hypothetical protein
MPSLTRVYKTDPIELQTSMQSKPQKKVERAAYIFERVESLGITISPASRLWQMLRILNTGHIEYNDVRFPIALEAIKDMHQLGLIVDEMDAHRNDERFVANVRKMLLDAATPQDVNSNTPGRDTQFELYLAAIALRAGMSPVEYEEPDVTCNVEGIKFGIAAKRLKSLDRFEERVKQGAKQIRRANFPGIIACDLTIARNPENRPITSSIQSQLSILTGMAKNRQLFERHEQNIHKWVANAGVRALLVFEFTYRVSPGSNSWIHEGMMCWFPTTENNESAASELSAFQRQFLKGIPNLNDLTEAS